jgi:hypothetical protein
MIYSVARGNMKLYHSTPTPIVEAIEAEGFRDAEGNYLTTNLYRGVWLGDRPIDWNDAGFTEEDMSCLTVEIPEEVVAPFEWIEEHKGYREFLVPAEVVNRYPILEVRSLWDCL